MKQRTARLMSARMRAPPTTPPAIIAARLPEDASICDFSTLLGELGVLCVLDGELRSLGDEVEGGVLNSDKDGVADERIAVLKVTADDADGDVGTKTMDGLATTRTSVL